MLGTRFLCGRGWFVCGDLLFARSHCSMADLSYVNPSAATTGSSKTPLVIGQIRASSVESLISVPISLALCLIDPTSTPTRAFSSFIAIACSAISMTSLLRFIPALARISLAAFTAAACDTVPTSLPSDLLFPCSCPVCLAPLLPSARRELLSHSPMSISPSSPAVSPLSPLTVPKSTLLSPTPSKAKISLVRSSLFSPAPMSILSFLTVLSSSSPTSLTD
mmetsp:Transcript_18742/g.38403  ORF Transcript_18742/g.38403 Transcript_18742/m.38403 type:complete len:221 (-) Transcript_18742:705-1367(-)